MDSSVVIRFNIAFCKYIAETAKIIANARKAQFVIVYDDEIACVFVNGIIMRIRNETITITHVNESGYANIIAEYEMFMHKFNYRFECNPSPGFSNGIAKSLATEMRALFSYNNNGYSVDNKGYIICIPGDELRLPFEMLDIKSTDEITVNAEYYKVLMN